MRTDSIEYSYSPASTETVDNRLEAPASPLAGGRRPQHAGEDAGAPRADDASAERAEGESEAVKRIGQCIAFMREHLNQPLQVATLAAKACTSPSHFFVLFKRVTGSPPIDYFIRLRMERACRLLEAGSWHVKEVAAALGYDDPFYFSRVFKSTVHVPPSEYRAVTAGAGRSRGNGENGAKQRNGSSPQFEISARVGNNGWNKRILRQKSSILHSKSEFAVRQ
jgi:AraC-like DNA-binding protein